jgi:hypothetical protein
MTSSKPGRSHTCSYLQECPFIKNKLKVFISLKPPEGLLASGRLSQWWMEANTLLLHNAVMGHHVPQQAEKLLVQAVHLQGSLRKH